MSKLLTLTSDDRSVASYPNTGNFTLRFSERIQFDASRPWSMALVRANIWYSWYNISDSIYGNAVFRYNNGVIYKQFTIPDGQYSFSALNSYIQAQITILGDVGTNISITPNYSTLKTTLTIAGGYIVDLSISNLYLLLGFSAAQAAAPIAVTTVSANIADITNGVDSLHIRTDIVGESYDGRVSSDILYTFVPSVSPGASIDVIPNERIYLRMRGRNFLDSIRIYITDQRGNILDLNGETVSIMLHFVQEKE